MAKRPTVKKAAPKQTVKKAAAHKAAAKQAAQKKTVGRRTAPARAASGSVARFNDLVKSFYEESFSRFPVWGSSVGHHQYDGDLGRATPGVFERQNRLVGRTLEAVEDLPPGDFTADAMLDRRTFLANLRHAQLEGETLARWRTNPQTHLQAAADAIHELVVKHGDDLAPAAGAILSRLRRVPLFLDEAAGCIRRPDPLWQRLTVQAAPGAAGLFTSLVEPLAAASGQPPARVRRLAEGAAAAARTYAERVGAMEPAAEGSFALGRDRFEALMRERLGIPWSPREAIATARRWAAELGEAMRREARRFHPRKSAAQILDEAAAEWAAGDAGAGDLLARYRATTRRIRERFEESGWVGFPKGDRLLVQPVPDFMRDQFPTAAYNPPGAFDANQTGIFFVNDLTALAASDKARRAELAQHFGLELTCAHEAYPGHHLQYVHQNRIPSPARRMAQHAVYYEGWTLWCEQMTADLMGDDKDQPLMRLKQLHDALWRAWRIVIDVGLGTGALTYDGACRILMREVGFTKARARGDVNWYTSNPTVPMSYLLGKMEVLRLKHRRVDSGAMSLREFNDWILSFGAIPWRWIEESGL